MDKHFRGQERPIVLWIFHSYAQFKVGAYSK